MIKQLNPVERATEDWEDDYGIAPTRVSVRAGASVTWTNASKVAHTIAAGDGSWSTRAIRPGETATLTFPRAGTFTYICKDHPWSIAQLIVE